MERKTLATLSGVTLASGCIQGFSDARGIESPGSLLFFGPTIAAVLSSAPGAIKASIGNAEFEVSQFYDRYSTADLTEGSPEESLREIAVVVRATRETIINLVLVGALTHLATLISYAGGYAAGKLTE